MGENDFFAEIAHESLTWRDYQVHVPIFYQDLRFMSISILASLNKIRSLLPTDRLKPYRITPWHSILSITAYEYRESDVDSYNEVAISVPVSIDKETPLFTGSLRKAPNLIYVYSHQLPVTTEFARVLGFEFAGYPKFIADIQFEDQDDWLICALKEDNQIILRLAGRKLPLTSTARSRINPITYRNGYILRSELISSEREMGYSRNINDARLELGDHKIASDLKQLRLGRILNYSYCPQVKFILTPVFESIKG
jgi:hypothetical protein